MALSHIINYTAATKGDGSCPLPRSHSPRARWVPVGILGREGFPVRETWRCASQPVTTPSPFPCPRERVAFAQQHPCFLPEQPLLSPGAVHPTAV